MPIAELELTESIYFSIRELLKVDNQIEQVGILFGELTDFKIRIDNFEEMRNLDASPSSFSIDYGSLVNYITRYLRRSKNLIGFFHSHPQGNSTLPSRKDKKFMKLWPYPYIWLIGVHPDKIESFTFLKGRIEHLFFTIKPDE